MICYGAQQRPDDSLKTETREASPSESPLPLKRTTYELMHTVLPSEQLEGTNNFPLWDDEHPTTARQLTCPHSFIFQYDPVENEADVLGGRDGPGPFLAKQVEDLGGQYCVLTVLDELAEVSKTRLLALWVLLNDANDAVNYGSLVLKATLQGKSTSSNMHRM